MAKQTKIQVFCAWCGRYMGTKDGKGVEGASHGICPKCVTKNSPELAKTTGGKE